MVLSMMSDSSAGTRALQSTGKSNLNRSASQKSPRGCESSMLRNLCQQLGPRTGLSVGHGNHRKRPGETTRHTAHSSRGTKSPSVSAWAMRHGESQDTSDLDSLRRHHHRELLARALENSGVHAEAKKKDSKDLSLPHKSQGALGGI